MKKTKEEQAITLIALVTTIVVLLILAGITITLVFGDNGIIRKAQEATDSTKEAQEQTTQGLQNLIDQMNNAIEGTNGGNNSGGDVTPEPEKWTQNTDGSITNGTVTVHIGDYIDYSSGSGEGSTATYTSYAYENTGADKNNGRTSGYTEDQTFKASEYTGKWRVLGVNENGELEIISEQNVPLTSGATTYVLGSGNGTDYAEQGKVAYQYAEEELEEISKIYGKGENATGARRITAEDINKITGYNPNNVGVKDVNQTGSGTKIYAGKLYEYGNKVTYTKPASGNVTYSGTNGLTGTTSYSDFTYYDKNSKTWKTLISGQSVELTSDIYYYYPNTLTTDSSTSGTAVGISATSQEYDMLFGNTSSATHYYWLGSPYVYTGASNALFGMRNVNSGYVYYGSLFGSYGYGITYSHGVRPVVSLKSDIQLKAGTAVNKVASWNIE